jgi:hypothetical protein
MSPRISPSFFFSFLLAVLGLELKASRLLGKPLEQLHQAFFFCDEFFSK